jgi:hypothetical protein
MTTSPTTTAFGAIKQFCPIFGDIPFTGSIIGMGEILAVINHKILPSLGYQI